MFEEVLPLEVQCVYIEVLEVLVSGNVTEDATQLHGGFVAFRSWPAQCLSVV